MSNTPSFRIALLSIALSIGGVPVHAQVAPPAPVATGGSLQPADPDTELLHSATVRLTRGDYDAQLSRLPEDSRAGFGTNIDRINTLLRIMLVDKTLAHEAREAGLDRDPDVQKKIAAETDRLLAQAVMERQQAKWEKEFDSKPNMEQAARERWLTHQDKYRLPEQVEATLLLYAVPKHKPIEAKQLAQAARQKIMTGADMNALAKAESDDPAAATTGGRVDSRTAKDLDPRVLRMATSLKDVGDVSRPVEGEQGFWLIRLDAKHPGGVRPFDQAKASIIGELRREYVDQQRSTRMAAIRNDPAIVVNQPAVDALVVRINPEYMKKALEAPAPGSDAGKGSPASK